LGKIETLSIRLLCRTFATVLDSREIRLHALHPACEIEVCMSKCACTCKSCVCLCVSASCVQEIDYNGSCCGMRTVRYTTVGLYSYTTPCPKKKQAQLLLSELRQISLNFDNFFGTKRAKTLELCEVTQFPPRIICVNALPC